MNWIPARLTWLLLTAVAFFARGYSAQKSLRVGWQQHAIVPGPNSGWSEAAIAGALQRKLIGPIWAGGLLVTELWLGDPSDPPAGTGSDLGKAIVLVVATGIAFASAAVAILAFVKPVAWIVREI